MLSKCFLTVLVLQRQLISMEAGRQCGNDTRPRPIAAPLLVAAVHRVPRAKLRHDLAPAHTRTHHPEQPGEHRAVIARHATPLPGTWREQRREVHPQGIGQQRCAGHPHRSRRQRHRQITSRPLLGVATLRRRLVRASPARPVEEVPLLLRWRGTHMQQTPRLWNRQRDQSVTAPFSSSPATRARVTTSAA